jgi:hypothetical protein
MKIHIICPFMRHHLLKTLLTYLEPMNIEWHPIVMEDEKFDIDLPWVHPLVMPNVPFGGVGFKKMNYFLDTQEIINDDYYCFMGDDDMYEQGFFDEIRKQTAKIIYVSLSRGNAIPTYEGVTVHPTFPLIISKPEDVRICNIGLPQYIMKGEVIKHFRFNCTLGYADGLVAEEAKEKFPNDYIFLSDLFAFGNYFEPERYTNNEWKLKSHWELPKII